LKLIIIIIAFWSTAKPCAAENASAFNHWDLVAAISINNDGKVNVTVLYFSDNIKNVFTHDEFQKEVEKWAVNLKNNSLLYAMKIQDSKKKSATWKISNETFIELHKISRIMQDAKLDIDKK
jgi:hypothetical protein